MATDWHSWHTPYADEFSPLSRRLRIVQGHIRAWLDLCDAAPVTVVSMCAGQGLDILQVLAGRPGANHVQLTLIEFDPRNAAAARQTAVSHGLSQVGVRCADAGLMDSYVDAVPADLVLMCGVFGNVSDDDVERTITALPQLCAPAATVIWTRSRRAPDMTGNIRGWFADDGFEECAFEAPDDVLFSVGVHRLTEPPRQLLAGSRMFEFAR